MTQYTRTKIEDAATAGEFALASHVEFAMRARLNAAKGDRETARIFGDLARSSLRRWDDWRRTRQYNTTRRKRA